MQKKETFKLTFMKSQKLTRPAYQKLIEIKTDDHPVPCQQKWNNALQEEYDLNWHTAYQITFKCIRSAKLIAFRYWFLHQILATNASLVKMVHKTYTKCTVTSAMKSPKAYLVNLWLWIYYVRPDTSKYNKVTDFISLVARFFIWLCRSHVYWIRFWIVYVCFVFQKQSSVFTDQCKI